MILNNRYSRIYLLGMPGCGKTTLGLSLSTSLKWNFVDLDALIEVDAQKSIPDIFSQDGENVFREIESRLLKQTNTYTNTVISLGGGAPCFFDNMDFIVNNGLSIFLDVSPQELYKRVSPNTYTRPLFQDRKDDLLTNITDKRNNRIAFYQNAHINLIGDNLTTKDLIANIEQHLATL